MVYTLCDDQVLLMHRHKEPNLGLWIPPGGKVELGEAPHETARREMREETGLEIETLHMRGFCTEVSPQPDWMWFLFIFVTRQFHGTLQADPREGRLEWFSIDTYLSDLPIPQADRIFAPRVLALEEGCFYAKFVYDEDLKLVAWTAY